MGKNLRQKCRTIVFHSFKQGRKKHEDKKKGLTSGKIYSYSTRKAMLQMVNNYVKWLCANHPEVRAPEEIAPIHVTEFLMEKAITCTQATVDTYRSRLASYGACVRVQLRLKVYDLHVAYVYAQRKGCDYRGAQAAISRAEYDLLLAYCWSRPSGSAYAILLENHLGGRVTDVCERMRISNCVVIMKCKGGKKLYRKITAPLALLLTDPRFAAWRTAEGKFRLPQAGSINKYLTRVEAKLELEHHSFHDLRRLLAQERYGMLRRSGMDQKRALSEVGVWLNHGPNRQSLVTTSYVADPW